MDPTEKEAQWARYSRIWHKILGEVLQWPPERVTEYIEELRREMDRETQASHRGFGFFYDLPSRYVFRPLLGEGLHERIMDCKSNDANPHLIYQRLVGAITGQTLEKAMEREDFDWQEARVRYQSERHKIERWLASLEGGARAAT
jgi:hypothetical protein